MNLSTAHNTWKKCGFALACLCTLVSAADPAPDNADRAQRNAAAASRTGAAAEAALVVIEAKLPTTGQRRLRDRAAAFTVINQSAVSAPLRFKGDAVLIARMIELGYPDADAFYVPIASVGAAPLVLRFEARSPDARAEAIAVLRGMLAFVDRLAPEFVAIYGSVENPATTAPRYDWLFWREPGGGWALLNKAPSTCFKTKLASRPSWPRCGKVVHPTPHWR